MSKEIELRENTSFDIIHKVLETQEQIKHELKEMGEKYERVISMLSERNLQNILDVEANIAEEGAGSSFSVHHQQSTSHVDVSFAEIGSFNHGSCPGDAKNHHKGKMSANCEVVDILSGKHDNSLIYIRWISSERLRSKMTKATNIPL